MGFEQIHNRGATESAASVAWSISFGDLLTLLVCFFLVLTQSTVFTPPHSHKDRQVILPGDVGHPAGTSLATVAAVVTVSHKEPRVPALIIEIPRSSAENGVIRTLSEEFDVALGRLIDKSQGRRGYLKVQLCSQDLGNELATEVYRFIEQSSQQLKGWEVALSSVCKGETHNAVGHVVAVVEFSEQTSR